MTLYASPDAIPSHRTRIVLAEKAPFDGPIYVRVTTNGESQVHALGQRVASQVFVAPVADAAPSE